MRFSIFLLTITILIAPNVFAAEQSQAKEVARLNNCVPKKVEVFQSSLGANGKTIYRVDCNMPKGKGSDAKPGADALLIGCDESICEVIRPVLPATK